MAFNASSPLEVKVKVKSLSRVAHHQIFTFSLVPQHLLIYVTDYL